MTEAFVQVNQVRHVLTETTRRSNLLHVLRNDLQLNGPKYGCGLGECGSCTVWVDGVAARACAIPARGVAGREITTLEGLAPLHGVPGELHPVQQAFIDAQAAQCGYCLSGMIIMTASLLADSLCWCTASQAPAGWSIPNARSSAWL